MLNWEKNPVVLLVLATVAIATGTVVTMAAPFAVINTEDDRIEAVVPYAPLQLAGRDVYVREGCNNCHSQTVRPLIADVLRYGPPSKSGEFVFDRPFLWGSRRTGPDLARVGGKFPDEWHARHLTDPRAMVPDSNMPAYAFLNDGRVDPDLVRRKMEVLDFPFDDQQIAALDGKTEMDALVAYLQKLGSDIGWRARDDTELRGPIDNPFEPTAEILAQGEALYARECAACHGAELEGDLGPAFEDLGYTDEEFFESAYAGIEDAGMPSFKRLGRTKLWKIVTFIDSKANP